MPKKILIIIFCAVLALSLCACGRQGTAGNDGVDGGEAHVELMLQVRGLAEAASKQYDAGLTFQSEYLYGLAQAEISSLRLCVDYVLWLKGEGANLAEVIGDAPYRTWDEVVGAGLGSDAPFYFEGLLFRFQGEQDKAEECLRLAGANPLHQERDFYYLRRMSVEELYDLKAKAAELENELYGQYSPRTVLLDTRTGAEFSPAYHLAMAGEREGNAAEAAQCALNALLASPLTPSLYGNAAALELEAGNVDLAVEILNEGLFLAPEDPSVNYVAALYARASGNDASAKAFLETARAGAEGDLLDRIDALLGQLGG